MSSAPISVGCIVDVFVVIVWWLIVCWLCAQPVIWSVCGVCSCVFVFQTMIGVASFLQFCSLLLVNEFVVEWMFHHVLSVCFVCLLRQLANLPTDPHAVARPRRLQQGDNPAREETNPASGQLHNIHVFLKCESPYPLLVWLLAQPVVAAAGRGLPAEAAASAVEVEQPVHPPTLTDERATDTPAASTDARQGSHDRWVATKEWVRTKH